MAELFGKIHAAPTARVSLHSFEIWLDGTLVAGEIGSVVGSVYCRYVYHIG